MDDKLKEDVDKVLLGHKNKTVMWSHGFVEHLVRHLYDLCQKQEAMLNKEIDVEKMREAINRDEYEWENWIGEARAAFAGIKRQQMEEV